MDDIRNAIASCCKQLRLSSNLADRAMMQEGDTNQEYLYHLLKNEIENRRQTRITKLRNTAGFPKQYTPEQFRTDEIDFPEGISFDTLMDLDFYDQGKNVIMYGGTGTGKTMLSILIGTEACKRGIPVKFYRTAGLINQFTENQQRGTLSLLKRKLNSAQIIILDEFGYVPYDRDGINILFDFLSEISDDPTKVVILNTNLEFSRWVNVLYDQKMTAALIGRLTHHCHLILFPGENNRLKESSINMIYRNIADRQERMQR